MSMFLTKFYLLGDFSKTRHQQIIIIALLALKNYEESKIFPQQIYLSRATTCASSVPEIIFRAQKHIKFKKYQFSDQNI